MILSNGQTFDLKGKKYTYKDFSSLTKYDNKPLFLVPSGVSCEITNSDKNKPAVLSQEKDEHRKLVFVSKGGKLKVSGNIELELGGGSGISTEGALTLAGRITGKI